MTHDELKEAALEAVRKVFADTSVPQEKTKESLEEIEDAIQSALDALSV